MIKLLVRKIIPLSILLTAFLGVVLFIFQNAFVYADEIDDVQKEIDAQNQKLAQIQTDLDSSKSYLESLKKNRSSLYSRLGGVEDEVEKINAEIENNQKEIETLGTSIQTTKTLLDARISQKNARVKNLYYQFKSPVWEILLNYSDLGKFTRLWEYKESGVASDRENLLNLNTELESLNTNFEKSKVLKEELTALNVELTAQVTELKTEIASANSMINSEQQRQTSLSSEMSNIKSSISNLTAKQQELIRQKLLATQFNTSVGSAEQGVQYLEAPGFTDGFAFFSYGYPHRVGMSQYGAYGRAKAGQTAEQILSAYFSNVQIDKNYAVPETIPVLGYGQINLQDYLKGLGEMPSCWDLEALKSQAIAARTYALNYIYYSWNGSEFAEKSPTAICTTQACQVYLGGWKGGTCAENWYKAVDETKNWVITYKGKPITAWYASTAGGYTRSAENVWGSYRPWALALKDFDAEGNAYDGPKYGNSPWYHKAWGKTDRGNAWLTNEETQDMFNAYLLSEFSSSYNQYLSPTDSGGWSRDAVVAELEKNGISPVGKISAIVMKDDGTGYIESVIIDSEKYGLKSFDGYKFRSMFNLRSIGTLVIWSSRYDVQKS